jgi:hypothetical protein
LRRQMVVCKNKRQVGNSVQSLDRGFAR